MERRHFLKLAFGFAAGGIALAASAQAAPLMPAPLARRQTARQSRCPTRRHVGRGGRSPHAGGSALGPRPSSRLGRGGGAPALGLAPPPLASPALGLASPPSLAPPLLASSSLLLVNRRQDCLERIKKAPRERGFCLALEISISAAASVAPHGAIRAAATGTYHHNRAAPPHAAARPQLPGEWVGICRRDREPSPGRILARLPLGRSWQRCPGPKLLRKGTSCCLPFLTAWAARLGT